MLTIFQAAIRDHDGKVYTMPKPARHHDIIHFMANKGIEIPITGEQGFITNEGVFVDRYEARIIAVNAHQLLDRAGGTTRLYSEDVWIGRLTQSEINDTISHENI